MQLNKSTYSEWVHWFFKFNSWSERECKIVQPVDCSLVFTSAGLIILVNQLELIFILMNQYWFWNSKISLLVYAVFCSNFTFTCRPHLLYKLCFHPKILIQFMRKTGISHKTFANKAPFPSNDPKRTKSSLPGKLALNITKKTRRSHWI